MEPKKTVLIVEDDNGVRAAVASILERKGYRPLLARDAETAYPFVKVADAMLLDVFLPGMTGDDFLRRIRNEGNYIPVVIMSAALSETSIAESMKDLKVVSFVAKPFKNADLVAKVDEACKLAAQMQDIKSGTNYLKGFIKRQMAAY